MSLLWVLLGCALALAICWVRVQSRREGVFWQRGHCGCGRGDPTLIMLGQPFCNLGGRHSWIGREEFGENQTQCLCVIAVVFGLVCLMEYEWDGIYGNSFGIGIGIWHFWKTYFSIRDYSGTFVHCKQQSLPRTFLNISYLISRNHGTPDGRTSFLLLSFMYGMYVPLKISDAEMHAQSDQTGSCACAFVRWDEMRWHDLIWGWSSSATATATASLNWLHTCGCISFLGYFEGWGDGRLIIYLIRRIIWKVDLCW